MTPDTPPGDAPIVPQPPTAASRPRLGRWALLAFAVAVLACGAAAVWWRLGRGAPAMEPPMPPNIQELEVKAAIGAMRDEVLKHPRDAGAWGRLGMVFEAHLFDHEADRCYAEAAHLDPTDARWPYGRGFLALRRGEDGGLPLLRQAAAAAASGEQHSDIRLALADALLERRDLNGAAAIYQDEWRQGPNGPRAAFGLGLIAAARGDDAAAQKYFTAARSNEHVRKQATAQLAALARARGDDPAAAAYEKETAAWPDDSVWPDPFLDEIVDLQVGRRRRDREVTQLERDQRYAEAVELHLRQIEEDPSATMEYSAAGLDLVRLGQYERAFSLLREGVHRDPESAEAHQALALGLFTAAEKEWERSPGSPQLKELFAEAAEHSRRATELKPDHAQAYFIWGLSLKFLGRPAEGVAPLQKGVVCRPEAFDLQLALGETLLDAGRDEEAATHLENARRLDPSDPRPSRDLERLRKTDKGSRDK